MIRSYFANFFVSALLVTCALLFAQSTGCGGGGGGSGSSGGAFLTPQVLTVSPSDNALEISILTTQIVATFSADMDASTINTNTVIVRDDASNFITGTVAYDATLRSATWTLTQTGLNPTFPTLARFDFDTVYRIELTSGIKANGLPIVPAVNSQFKTAATQFGLDPVGTSPLPNATGVLIDPFRAIVNGSLVLATLKVKIDVALDPTSISDSSVLLRVGGQGGTLVPAGVGFDTASNTILLIPSATANANPGFPGEPLLQTATAYTIEVTTSVQDTSNNSPTSPLFISFTTIACGIRAPANVPALTPPATASVADLQLAECFAAPFAGGTTDLTSDSNGDGFASAVSDEFVEVVNISTDYINLFDHLVKDAVPQNPTAFDFSTLSVGSRHFALLAPGRSIIIWNGVESGRTIPNAKLVMGHSKAFAGGINGSMSSLWNNSNVETAVVKQKNPAPGSSGDCMIANFTNTGSGAATSSMVRDPELTGGFVRHGDQATVSGGAKFSPGLRTNGSVYP